MIQLIGLGVTVLMVFGGYMLAGGKLSIILHSLPFEMMMIGGAATGAFLAANDFATIKHAGSDVLAVVRGPKWRRADYQDLLCLMHELTFLLRTNPAAVEAHVEDPAASDVFSRYPRIQADAAATEIICDTIRSMTLQFDDAYQVEEMLEKQLGQMREDALHGAHALSNVADALPALGIVAAVLGVIKTMASIDKPPEVLGQMIGGALVGTFLGVFLAYGFVGPFAARVKALREEEHAFYRLIRETIVSTLHGQPETMAAEVARRGAPHRVRPSFAEVDEALRALKKAG